METSENKKRILSGYVTDGMSSDFRIREDNVCIYKRTHAFIYLSIIHTYMHA